MKNIVHKDGKVVAAFDAPVWVTIKYPELETAKLYYDDNDWEKVKQNPEQFVYKEGKLKHNKSQKEE